MQEIWKDIKGYEGLYQVSNCGNVKSLNYNHTGEHRLLAQNTNGRYPRVNFSANGVHRSFSVHRLVATAFALNPENKPCVNHISGVRTDNHAGNLEWCTQKENSIHAYETGLNRPSKETIEKLVKGAAEYARQKRKAVVQFNLNGEYITRYDSVLEAHEKTGTGDTAICNVSRGLATQAGEFFWMYEKDYIRHGLKLPEKFVHQKRSVLKFSPNGELLSEYETLRDAAKEVGVISYSIGEVCRGKEKHAGGFLWLYKEDYEKGKRVAPLKYLKRFRKIIKQLTPSGELIAEHRSIRAAERATGCWDRFIRECYEGKRETYGGYKWELA